MGGEEGETGPQVGPEKEGKGVGVCAPPGLFGGLMFGGGAFLPFLFAH